MQTPSKPRVLLEREVQMDLNPVTAPDLNNGVEISVRVTPVTVNK